MYTKLDDRQQAHKVNEILQAQPSITQKELCRKLITNWHRLKYLEQQGYLTLKRRNANDAKTNTLICE